MRRIVRYVRQAIAVWQGRHAGMAYECGYRDHQWDYVERQVTALSNAERAAFLAGWQDAADDQARGFSGTDCDSQVHPAFANGLE